MEKRRLCKYCKHRPADMPDREAESERKEVCARCHRARLLNAIRALEIAEGGRPR